MNDRKRKAFPRILRFSACLIALFTVTAIVFGAYKCPLYTVFGIPCPGCGMTRAMRSLLHLDFRSAFEYHSLFPLPILLAGYHIARRIFGFPVKIENFLVAVSFCLFLTRWVYIIIN